MCSNVDFPASKRRKTLSSSSHADGRQGAIRALAADTVRASRLRHLVERCVIAGLAAPGSGLAKRPPCLLPLAHSARGGSEVAFARQLAMYLAHVALGLTYEDAAALYGRHAKTAAHGCRVVEDRRDDPRFDRIVALLEQAVRVGLAQIEPAAAVQFRDGACASFSEGRDLLDART